MLYSKIEGSGRSLLILHGFLGMSDNWKTLGTRWAEVGYEVHLIDLRNHGRSLQSEDFNYTVMAQDIFDYCKAKNLESIYIMGHSMGGKVAMLFAVGSQLSAKAQKNIRFIILSNRMLLK